MKHLFVYVNEFMLYASTAMQKRKLEDRAARARTATHALRPARTAAHTLEIMIASSAAQPNRWSALTECRTSTAEGHSAGE